MHILELVLEITRQCQLRCRHCLRGDPQPVNMSSETVDRLLEGVDYISTVTFTGGEPSLNVPIINHFFKVIGNKLGGFYVITNGMEASEELAQSLLNLYHVSERKTDCSLIVSRDQYHVCDPKAVALYSSLPFFKLGQKHIEVLAEGRATWGWRQVPRPIIELELDTSGIRRCNSPIYINVFGDVCFSCDLSYESQEKHKIGNVYEKSIPEILKHLVKDGV